MGLSIRHKMLLMVFFCMSQMFGQHELILKKGGITRDLKVPEYEDSQYTVYLPVSFNLAEKWPVLVGFDSGNDPIRLASLLRGTAEELGYIVVVSNFSKKASIKDKVTYISKFLHHIITTLPLDRRRMYAVGYEQDAVLTSALPIVFKELDGVISIQNSFDFFRNEKIRKNFYYAGVVGDRNHTYLGLLEIRKYLKSKAIPAEVYVFDSKSSLPSSDLITKVVSSFQIRDMLNGKIPRDSIWLKNTYEKNLAEVEVQLAKNEFLEAHQELRRMSNTYKFIRDLKPLKKKMQKISRIREYQKQKNSWRKFTNQERWWRNEFELALQEDIRYYGFSNLGWWRFRINELEKSSASNKQEEVAMAVRLKGYVRMLLNAADNQVMIYNKASIDQKLFIKVLYTVLNPKDFNSYQNIISLSARDGDYATALFYLEEMLKNGFNDIKILYNIEGTLSLRLTKGYNDIVKKYLKTSGYQQYK